MVVEDLGQPVASTPTARIGSMGGSARPDVNDHDATAVP
jgi:hypothetical protein